MKFGPCLVVLLFLASSATAQERKIDFNRQIRPILSDNCFACHGPDPEQRKAKLRLDTFDGATAKLRRSGHGIVPGHPESSSILNRIASDDPSEVMPPPRTQKKVTPAQLELLRQWIREGASYAEHWAFALPKRPALPAVQNEKWVRNPVDRFILAGLEKAGLTPSPEADRVTLIRRLSLDLLGLPPTPAEVDAFIADRSPDAYERLVDRLFASPHYGERLTLDWLDAARFADTHGYHIDSGRDMTRWRDYVIDSFNANLPFDRFTVEQLAGDLLPNATPTQKIASGFNRNHMINFEGGAVADEYLSAYIVDRVNTTSTVWLGLTVACAQCHDHKYDPIRQKDFYRLYAIFHNVPERGLDGAKGNAEPLLRVPTKAQQAELARIARRLEELDQLAMSPLEDPAAAAVVVKTQKAELAKRKAAIEKSMPTAMVMQEMPQPRDTFLLMRGEYDKKGEKVTAGLPSFLPGTATDKRVDRLTLAKWLVGPENPLTRRVIVNRYWQMIFGAGLVRTPEDFGSQGEPPTHPELLDWLAVEFAEPGGGQVGWSVRDLLRLYVTSATYRQSSALRPELLAKDRDNRLYARGSRHRLQAELIRDQALAVSGLLNKEIGGKSVSPYQPTGLWQELASRGDSKNWSAQFFEQSHGKDLYRRTMYTFWKRTSPPPQLVAFDAPDRETCTVRRSRTNTPLQALILMNDPTYVEASRKLAERVMKSATATDDRIRFAFRVTVARTPTAREIEILRAAYEKQHARFRAEPAAAGRLLGVGESARDPQLDVGELAAWSMVASTLLNLDETVTKN